MNAISTFLWFDGDAETAAHHYVSIFPNSSVTNVSRQGEAADGMPAPVRLVSFELDGRPLTALNGGPDLGRAARSHGSPRPPPQTRRPHPADARRVTAARTMRSQVPRPWHWVRRMPPGFAAVAAFATADATAAR